MAAEPIPLNPSSPSNSDPLAAPRRPRMSGRNRLLFFLTAWLIVLMPFLFWWNTWFGRPLTDQKMTAYLQDELILEIGGHLLVRQGTAKPRVPPEQERHQDDQPRGKEKQQPIAPRHARPTGRRQRIRVTGTGRIQWDRFGRHRMSVVPVRALFREAIPRCSLALVQERQDAVIPRLPIRVQKKHAGQGQQDQAHEEAIDGGDRAGGKRPRNPEQGNNSEHDRNQEHHRKQ